MWRSSIWCSSSKKTLQHQVLLGIAASHLCSWKVWLLSAICHNLTNCNCNSSFTLTVLLSFLWLFVSMSAMSKRASSCETAATYVHGLHLDDVEQVSWWPILYTSPPNQIRSNVLNTSKRIIPVTYFFEFVCCVLY